MEDYSAKIIRLHTKLLAVASIVIIIINLLLSSRADDDAIFREVVSFGGFNTTYDKPFTIKDDTQLQIKLKIPHTACHKI
jgi:hypothetical protein